MKQKDDKAIIMRVEDIDGELTLEMLVNRIVRFQVDHAGRLPSAIGLGQVEYSRFMYITENDFTPGHWTKFRGIDVILLLNQ